jgi:glycine oxidase
MSQSSAKAADVVVVGAGVIGLSIAWRAALRGLAVTVLERGAVGAGASHVAAGMLAPVSEAAAAEQPLLELGMASAGRYGRFVDELNAAAGGPGVEVTECGTLLVARDVDEARALDRELELRRRFGLSVTRLRPSEARRLEPGLAPTLRLALEAADDHAIDPRALVAALHEAALRGGATVREHTPVAALTSAGGDRVTGVVLRDGSEIAAAEVVIAAGSWTGAIGGLPAPARLSIRPVKGQILRLHDPAGPGLLTRVIRMGPSYIVPRGDGRYVIGATQEERGFDTTVTAGAGFELLRDASELVPGVSELVLDEFAAGLRPATADNMPAIGAGAVPGLHWAVGHRRGGILLAPVTAEIVVASLIGEEPAPMARDFAPSRFAPAATAGSPA